MNKKLFKVFDVIAICAIVLIGMPQIKAETVNDNNNGNVIVDINDGLTVDQPEILPSVDPVVTPNVTIPTVPIKYSTLPITDDSIITPIVDAVTNPIDPGLDGGDIIGDLNPIDDIAPVITVPNDIVMDVMTTTNGAGAFITYGVSAIDETDGQVTVTCDHPSGSFFNPGLTEVTCTASDLSGNPAVPVHFNVYIGEQPLNNNGENTLNQWNNQVIINSTNNNGNTTINVPSEVANPSLNLNSLVNNNSATLNSALIINSSIGGFSQPVQISIPAGTTINAQNSWDGKVLLPVTMISDNSLLPQEANTNQILTSITLVGAINNHLTFDKAVRIMIPGKAGERVGYSVSGEPATEITTVCSADTQEAGNALPAGGDCKINVGNDLVIYTKHFTTFVTYTSTAITPPPPVIRGGGSGYVPFINNNQPVVQQTPVTVNPIAPVVTPQVLGVKINALDAMIKAVKFGDNNVKVAQLQKELQQQGFLPKTQKITNYYGAVTKAAVKKYQDSQKGQQVLGVKIVNVKDLINKVKPGQTNDTVKQLQAELIKQGLLKGSATGYYGSLTKAAVKKYLATNK